MNSEKTLKVDIGGEEYILTSDDNYLDHIRSGFEPEMVKLFKVLLKDCEIVLDIGANIGCTAILFGGLSKKVYAFEPSPTTFSFLHGNLSASGRTNVIPINLGLGHESGEFTLTFSPSNRSGGFVSNQTHAGDEFKVEKIAIQRLDEVVNSLKIRRIDFIKIDVEGFEGDVLRGAKQTLMKYKPLVVLELNHWCLNAFQRTSIPDFFDFLRSNFPVLLAVDGENYLDLHNEGDSYTVMYHHILHMRFPNIVAAYNEEQLGEFRQLYHVDFKP